VLVLTGCTGVAPAEDAPAEPGATTTATVPAAHAGEVSLALAGDVHFEGHVRRLLRGGGDLGPIAETLRAADVAMVNLETPVTDLRVRDPKELEHPGDRYWFRTRPQALDVLADAGVDVVSVANNHAGDYGSAGLDDTLAAGEDLGIAMVGAGAGEAAAFTPHVVTVGDLEVAFLAADSTQREGGSDAWDAASGGLGTASARGGARDLLLDEVQEADADGRLVVVYVHWGREHQACPTQSQRLLARDLADAGADAVVGSHGHVLGGAGWAGDTYVSYGLGNFVWYHARQADTGVLTLRLDADGVVGETWTPATISARDGRPAPVPAGAAPAALAGWEGLRRCTGLAADPGTPQADDPAYASSVDVIDTALAQRMRRSHRPGCPVPLADLRHLEVAYRDFDGRARTGELVVHERWARQVVTVFGRLYDAGWPIARMRLVDDYGADDDASMAAGNTSGFNCRRVDGQRGWSQHAYGAAIDLNPVQNPYVRPGRIDPPAGRRFAAVDRGRSAPVALGVIRAGDLPVTAFARIGWEWGGDWVSSKDYQHVAAPGTP
jgi:hypothetical protein